MKPLTTTEPPICPECRRPAQFVTGRELFSRRPELADHGFWVCYRDNTRVGCHPGTNSPFGDMVGPEVRKARQSVHAAMDPHWLQLPKRQRGKARDKAYRRLAKGLGLTKDEAHVGMFSMAQCVLALRVIESWGPPPGLTPGVTKRYR